MSTYTLRFARHGINSIGHALCNSFQLIYVNRIRAVYTRTYIANCFTTVIQSIFSKTYDVTTSRSNGYATAVHNRRVTCGILSRYGRKTFQIFRHTNFKISAVRYNTYIIFCSQLASISNTTDYIYLFVKLFVNHITEITTVFHTIVFGCHLMCLALFILVLNTSNSIASEIRITLISSYIRIATIFAS